MTDAEVQHRRRTLEAHIGRLDRIRRWQTGTAAARTDTTLERLRTELHTLETLERRRRARAALTGEEPAA